MTDALRLENIHHDFEGLAAVRGLSISVAAGEVVCLLGPSGCGKTTTLRIAAGVERQQAGRVLIDGQEVAGPARFVPPEKRRVGLMFQDFALFPHLNVINNVGFGLKHVEREARLARSRDMLERVGMARFAHAFPHTLSGGEQQRVALARAMAPEPRIMLMDEPFSGLDARLRDAVRDETLRLLKERGAATLLVTHDPAEAMHMADRIALMREGAIIQLATAEEMYNAPVDIEAAAFFSDLNIIEGRVSGGAVATPFGLLSAPGLDEGAAAIVAFRPGALRIVEGGGPVGIVRFARFLGTETLVRLEMTGHGQLIQARLPGQIALAAGDSLVLGLDHAQAFVFPRRTG
jgi:iron(III) transport system ATP-binding protein